MSDRYLVISAHTLEDCRMAISHFETYHAGFLTNFEWGCYDKDHHAYAIIEADSHEHALMSVPPLFRDRAKVIKLTYFKATAGADPAHQSA